MIRSRATLIAVVASAACAASPASAATRTAATVTRVLDGDSVRVTVAGRPATVSLLGVRAPQGGDCFAAQSRRLLSRLAPRGVRLTLEADPRRFGGRYVLRGRTLINAAVLRAGAARPARLGGLRRAGALRRAARLAEAEARGLFERCAEGDDPGSREPAPAPGGGGAQSPIGGASGGGAGTGTGTASGTGGGTAGSGAAAPAPAPTASGPIEVARAVRQALTDRTLTDFNSSPNGVGSFSARNDTQFCAGARGQRREEFNGESGASLDEFVGTWAVQGAIREADGTIVAEIAFQADDPSVDTRVFTITIAPDGTVRKVGGKASQLTEGAQCGAPQPDPTLHNDDQTAREKAARALVGKRLTDSARSATTDFCAGPRALRRENGQLVLEGPWTIEYAVADDNAVLVIVALEDSVRRVSRRMAIGVQNGAAPQVRDLGVPDDDLHPAAFATAAC